MVNRKEEDKKIEILFFCDNCGKEYRIFTRYELSNKFHVIHDSIKSKIEFNFFVKKNKEYCKKCFHKKSLRFLQEIIDAINLERSKYE